MSLGTGRSSSPCRAELGRPRGPAPSCLSLALGISGKVRDRLLAPAARGLRQHSDAAENEFLRCLRTTSQGRRSSVQRFDRSCRWLHASPETSSVATEPYHVFYYPQVALEVRLLADASALTLDPSHAFSMTMTMITRSVGSLCTPQL